MSSCSTRRFSAISAGSTSCTCSATSARTRCRWRGLGARVTGVDFSPTPGARRAARRLAVAAGMRRFVESELYATGRRAGRRHSISSIRASARCVGCPTSRAGHSRRRTLLSPGGRLYLRDADRAHGGLTMKAPTTSSSSSIRTSKGPRPVGADCRTTYVDDLPISEPVIVRVESRPRRDRAGGARRGPYL